MMFPSLLVLSAIKFLKPIKNRSLLDNSIFTRLQYGKSVVDLVKQQEKTKDIVMHLRSVYENQYRYALKYHAVVAEFIRIYKIKSNIDQSVDKSTIIECSVSKSFDAKQIVSLFEKHTCRTTFTLNTLGAKENVVFDHFISIFCNTAIFSLNTIVNFLKNNEEDGFLINYNDLPVDVINSFNWVFSFLETNIDLFLLDKKPKIIVCTHEQEYNIQIVIESARKVPKCDLSQTKCLELITSYFKEVGLGPYYRIFDQDQAKKARVWIKEQSKKVPGLTKKIRKAILYVIECVEKHRHRRSITPFWTKQKYFSIATTDHSDQANSFHIDEQLLKVLKSAERQAGIYDINTIDYNFAFLNGPESSKNVLSILSLKIRELFLYYNEIRTYVCSNKHNLLINTIRTKGLNKKWLEITEHRIANFRQNAKTLSEAIVTSYQMKIEKKAHASICIHDHFFLRACYSDLAKEDTVTIAEATNDEDKIMLDNWIKDCFIDVLHESKKFAFLRWSDDSKAIICDMDKLVRKYTTVYINMNKSLEALEIAQKSLEEYKSAIGSLQQDYNAVEYKERTAGATEYFIRQQQHHLPKYTSITQDLWELAKQVDSCHAQLAKLAIIFFN